MVIDLKAPTVIKGFRTQGVRRKDKRLGFPTAIRLKHTNDMADKMREFRNVDGSPVEFRVLDGNLTNIVNNNQLTSVVYLFKTQIDLISIDLTCFNNLY